MSDWNIARNTGRCAATDQALGEGQVYYSVLFETEEGFVRQDYTEEAWPGPPPESFCHWKSQVPIKDKKPEHQTVDANVLLQLFLQLDEAESVGQQQFRFILALLLMRKRILKLEKTTGGANDDEPEYWHLRCVKDQTVYPLVNPRLESDQIERLSQQLTSVLSGEVSTYQALTQDPETVNANSEESGSEACCSETDGSENGNEW